MIVTINMIVSQISCILDSTCNKNLGEFGEL